MIQVKPKELEKLIAEVGLSKNELASALNVNRSSLWRWIDSGEIPDKSYVFLRVVRFEEGELGLRSVKFLPTEFKEHHLNEYADEIKLDFKNAFNRQSGEFTPINLDSIDTSMLLEELKRRNPDEQVIIARVKSLS